MKTESVYTLKEIAAVTIKCSDPACGTEVLYPLDAPTGVPSKCPSCGKEFVANLGGVESLFFQDLVLALRTAMAQAFEVQVRF
jgi:hypothetical protein